MLCDEVIQELAKGSLKVHASHCERDLLRSIRTAQRFCFADRSSRIVESLSNGKATDEGIDRFLKEQERAIAFFSMPYPVTWIELYAHRSGGAVDQARPGLPRIKKLGFLVLSEPSNPRAGEAFLFWSFRDKLTPHGAACSVRFDMDRPFDVTPTAWDRAVAEVVAPESSFDKQQAVPKHFANWPWSFKRLYQTAEVRGGQAAGGHLFLNAVMDWTGETNVLFWSVIMLNSRNGFEKRAVDPPRELNRARRLRGKEPMLAYHEVDLGEQYRYESPGDGEADPRRLHWRRGHFKCRKTGVFWWSPHLAGRKELGMVEKHYVA